jgi:hypothetical protein
MKVNLILYTQSRCAIKNQHRFTLKRYKNKRKLVFPAVLCYTLDEIHAQMTV